MNKLSLLPLSLLALYSSPIYANPVDWAEGSWGIDRSELETERKEELSDFRRCGDSPVIITVDPGRMRYKAVHKGEDDFTAEGNIIAANELFISIQYDNEERTFENGEPQIWHMFFDGPDRFFWVLAPEMHEDKIVGVSEPRERCLLRAL